MSLNLSVVNLNYTSKCTLLPLKGVRLGSKPALFDAQLIKKQCFKKSLISTIAGTFWFHHKNPVLWWESFWTLHLENTLSHGNKHCHDESQLHTSKIPFVSEKLIISP